jgi:hypothetical protein
MIPAIGLVATPVGSCIAALVAATVPATALMPSMEVLWVIQVLHIKAKEEQLSPRDESRHESASVDHCICQSCTVSCLCLPPQLEAARLRPQTSSGAGAECTRCRRFAPVPARQQQQAYSQSLISLHTEQEAEVQPHEALDLQLMYQ